MQKGVILILVLLLLPYTLLAETLEERGKRISTQSDSIQRGFGTEQATMTMILRDANGREIRRSMENLTMEVEGDDDKSLTRFLSPPDVAGTALLTHRHLDGDDDQWLYLPALRRVKRIAAKNKSGSFMGSEFTFEDISVNRPHKFSFLYLREEDIDGKIYDVIQRIPKYKNSGYTKIIGWIDRETRLPFKAEYYDRKGEKIKEAYLSDFKRYGDVYRIGRIVMRNLITKKESEIIFSKRIIGERIKASVFTKQELQRGR